MSSMKIELSTIGRTHVQWDDMGQHHTVRIALAPDDLASIAAANGYVKADDYEALKAKLAEVTDQLGDATDALDLIESEADLFDATAIASGHIKLADDEIVVKRGTLNALNALIDDHCADCTFDSLEIHDCATCDLKPIRHRIKATEATGAKAGPTVEDVIAITAALNDSGVKPRARRAATSER